MRKQLVMAKSTVRLEYSESLSINSSLTMGKFCDIELHTKLSNCFYAHDFAAFKEVYE